MEDYITFYDWSQNIDILIWNGKREVKRVGEMLVMGISNSGYFKLNNISYILHARIWLALNAILYLQVLAYFNNRNKSKLILYSYKSETAMANQIRYQLFNLELKLILRKLSNCNILSFDFEQLKWIIFMVCSTFSYPSIPFIYAAYNLE